MDAGGHTRDAGRSVARLYTMPLRLIDASVWVAFLRPRPAPELVDTVRRALEDDEAATAAPVVVEVLSGIRDRQEYAARDEDFRNLHTLPIDGEGAYVAARIGAALARTGNTAKTVDLLLAGAAITAGAELWSLPDAHFGAIARATARGQIRDVAPLRVVFLP